MRESTTKTCISWWLAECSCPSSNLLKDILEKERKLIDDIYAIWQVFGIRYFQTEIELDHHCLPSFYNFNDCIQDGNDFRYFMQLPFEIE